MQESLPFAYRRSGQFDIHTHFDCLTSALHTALLAAFQFLLLRAADLGLWRNQNVTIKRKMKWQNPVVCSAKSIKRQTINLQHRLGKTEVNYMAIQDRCTVVLCAVRVLLSREFWHSVLLLFENKYSPRHQGQCPFCRNVSKGFKFFSGSCWTLAKEISFYWLTWTKERRKP